MKYVKKQEFIDAMRWNGKNEYTVRTSLNTKTKPFVSCGKLVVNTLDGFMTANPGDYITCDENGNLFPMAPAKFEETYFQIREEVPVLEQV